MNEALAGVLALAGALAVAAGGVALWRFPDVYTRLSGNSLAGTFGLLAILLGLVVGEPKQSVILPASLLALFLVATLSLSSHIVARTAYLRGSKLRGGTRVDALKGKLRAAERSDRPRTPPA